MSICTTVALLAPVPLEHLESGELVCRQSGKVAYGSRAWDVFSRLDSLRNGLRVHTFFYASGIDDPIGKKVSWQASYIGFLDCRKVSGTYENQYRPPTTRQYPSDNRFDWPIFWEVESLQRMDDPIPIHRFRGLGMKRAFQIDFVPEGPILIQYRW